jgi:hypothetical protein
MDNMKFVFDSDGNKIFYQSAVNLMDDDIREELHAKLAPCTKQVFFDEYVKAHREKFNEDFVVM